MILISIVVGACIDQVQLPIRTEVPHLVVEGQITNEAPPYTIRLTYTGNYNGDTSTTSQYVQGAQVVLGDDRGRNVTFVPMGKGQYQTVDSTFRGQIGRTYSLSITLSDGKKYVSAPELFPDIVPIDSVSGIPVKTGNVVTPYAVSYSVNVHDPASEKNYYRWTAYGYTNRLSVGVPCSLGNPNLCNNRCWVLMSSENVNTYSDEAVNGNAIRRAVFQLPIYAIGPQLCEVQQYGMTQTNYQFWNLYQQQNARTGSIFDPLPAPVVGNVVNVNDPTDVARGYFAVTSVTRKRIVVRNYDVPFYGAITSFVASQIIPPGDCRATYGWDTPVLEPPGW